MCMSFRAKKEEIDQVLINYPKDHIVIIDPENEFREIRHNNGLYYGQKSDTVNLINIDRGSLKKGSCVIVGVSGGGKSFKAVEPSVVLGKSGGGREFPASIPDKDGSGGED